MKVLSVVGARPQFVKLAPIARECERQSVEHVIVHTGQHYDPMLSDVFFEELGIPAPDVHLGVGSGSHGAQTGAMLSALDPVLETHRPDWVLIYGDTNSTVAAALSAAKLHFPVAHLEAGLRSFNRLMPEEHNRVVADHVSDLLLAPTEQAAKHLDREGLSERTVIVGDVMTDVLFEVRDSILNAGDGKSIILELEPYQYYVATIHRAENTSSPERLQTVINALSSLDLPTVLLVHPRVAALSADWGVDLEKGNLRVHSALAYRDLVAAVMSSAGVVTDSGGLQKEAFLLRVLCTTVRTETEWIETVDSGWNLLANTADEIREGVKRPRPSAAQDAPYGDGFAARRVIEALRAHEVDRQAKLRLA